MREYGGRRVALVPHGRGTAGVGHGHLTDLGRGQQHDVLRNGRELAPQDACCGCQLGDPPARGVPRHDRRRELSSRATSATRSAAASPAGASVPTAPPSCTAHRSRRNRSTPAIASSTATRRPAHCAPNVVTAPCCSRVRPTCTVSRCSTASAANVEATARASPSAAWSARRATSIVAVSTMSWLVATR